MPRAASRFLAAVFPGWLVLALAAWIYAHIRAIPAGLAVPVAAAFLVEYPFYLWPAFAAPRRWLAAQPKPLAALLLTIASVLPWAALALPLGMAQPAHLLLLLLVAGAVSFWYVVLPAGPVSDAAILLLLAALQIGRVFDGIYPSPLPKAPLSILGHLMLIRTGALAFLAIREGIDAEFRFLPTRQEWANGLRYFAPMLPVVGAVYWALGLVNFRPQPLGPPLAIATFFGILWVVALSEEFFLRGLLQNWLERWTRSPWAALLIAALLSGAAHLGFHGAFPSWRYALVATVFHFFCGLAWLRTRTIQAGMVAHALTVTVWQVFFH
jgi:membrane protease YdiL (CAAX protease family)